ncbi:hypothetical protein JOD69_004919, partial [Methylocaldum sp. RMAD-M]|nr:hypothetical protein [Methylocaldum sp. RMAD-M]
MHRVDSLANNTLASPIDGLVSMTLSSDKRTKPRCHLGDGALGKRCLAVTYFRTGICTIIGA